ncbi:hypothetical protein JWJ90_22140 [Desulfobulbus rhabdoformis]|jgi:DNA-binding XRE family transcriptional regulator|uniref:hypothetical protein n=1 Tax=Desulfobulbus rhabdoformis TaxID=34032 RepID=UPI001965C6AD|nr:hypothetical protein [Desulfobulbus rhabdoformis]MBM9616964.1 hypothetical protein [Desulfobulbus rhabdoformis]
MDQLITNQFRAALTHLLAQEGRGAQARLSKKQNIDRGYLNAIVKGRKSGSEKIRSKIASHFDMAYEDVFVLGRRLLAQEEEPDANYGNQTWDVLETAEDEPTFLNSSSGDVVGFKVPAKGEEGSSSVQTRILKTIEVLESETKYGDLLAGLIDAFHDSLSTKREKETIH